MLIQLQKWYPKPLSNGLAQVCHVPWFMLHMKLLLWSYEACVPVPVPEPNFELADMFAGKKSTQNLNSWFSTGTKKVFIFFMTSSVGV